MKKNYYNILEVSNEATDEQIKMAVVQLGRKYAAKAQQNRAARSKFNEIQEAYRVLSNRQLRKYYDEKLTQQKKSGKEKKLKFKLLPTRFITTNSTETEPATTEPATTEPATTEPAITESATTEPAATEPTNQFKLNEIFQLFLVWFHKFRFFILRILGIIKERAKINFFSNYKQNVDTTKESEESIEVESVITEQNRLQELTKLPLNSTQIEKKKRYYDLLSDEMILFYSKPHLLSCLDIAALSLIFLSIYFYIADPLKEYMPTITLWIPSQFSTILPQISLWQLGIGTMLIMGIAIQLEVIIGKFSTELLLTQDRIIAKTGILGRKKTEIKLNAMESISIKESLLGRLFNYGSVIIIGMGQGKTVLRNVVAPHKMSRLIWFHLRAKL